MPGLSWILLLKFVILLLCRAYTGPISVSNRSCHEDAIVFFSYRGIGYTQLLHCCMFLICCNFILLSPWNLAVKLSPSDNLAFLLEFAFPEIYIKCNLSLKRYPIYALSAALRDGVIAALHCKGPHHPFCCCSSLPQGLAELLISMYLWGMDRTTFLGQSRPLVTMLCLDVVSKMSRMQPAA